MASSLPAPVTVRAPAKVNLHLGVGPLRDDGYHELVTVFQALDLHEQVTVELADDDAVTVTGRQADQVPTDGSNLALRAVAAVRERHGGLLADHGVAVRIDKQVPVAGGMAGGSADAAATLVALDALLGLHLDRSGLEEIGAGLGADVPFGILGGTALGRGRGDLLTPVLATGLLHWVLALAHDGLSTPAVFRECDRLRGEQATTVPTPEAEPGLLAALRAGDAHGVGEHLRNDLQAAACSLMPALAETLAVGRDAGALGALVSGSGPTTAFLAADAPAAIDLAVALTASGCAADVVRTTGPAHGARVVETLTR